MKRGRIDPRRIKIHRSYTIEELARLLGCHKNTARTWLKDGLQPLEDGKRPLLFQGAETKAFLERRRARAKKRCLPEEMYCFKCRAPQRPAGSMVDYTPSAAGGMLSGLCSACSTLMFKQTSRSVVEQISLSMDVKINEPTPTPNMAAPALPKL